MDVQSSIVTEVDYEDILKWAVNQTGLNIGSSGIVKKTEVIDGEEVITDFIMVSVSILP